MDISGIADVIKVSGV